jgi:hypothetical protein
VRKAHQEYLTFYNQEEKKLIVTLLLISSISNTFWTKEAIQMHHFIQRNTICKNSGYHDF